jgi:glycosyltransferase involved in cell wall biosynthesis
LRFLAFRIYFMHVALVHDYLVEYGGAERVLEALYEIWPEAPLYTAYYNPKGLGPHAKKFKKWDIRESWAKYLPFMPQMLSPYRILAPLFFESFDFSKFNVVISSTDSYFAKSILTTPKALHICYCHTPPRALYGYPVGLQWKKFLPLRVLSEISTHFLRILDYVAAQRVDYFVANSKNTAARIKKFYRREARVVYPPVDIKGGDESLKQNKLGTGQARITNHESRGFFLFVSRLTQEKRADLAVKACSELGLPLKVVGGGPQEGRLRKIAGPTVEFLGYVSDRRLWQIYADCKAFIYPAEEQDFGIVPVEAMAAGKPVIALAQGGVLESVVPGKTGEFFKDPTVESLIRILKRFDISNYQSEDCIRQAKKFSKERFKVEIKKFVETKYWEHKSQMGE